VQYRWANGKGLAWFCDSHSKSWAAEHKGDINTTTELKDGKAVVKKARLELEALPAWTFIDPLKDAFRDLDRVDVYKAYGTMEDLFGNLARLELLDPRDVREGTQLAKRLVGLRKDTLDVMVDASNLFEVIKRRAKR
jgi:hypothetical protein